MVREVGGMREGEETGRSEFGTRSSFSRMSSMEGCRDEWQLVLSWERNSTAPMSTRLTAATSCWGWRETNPHSNCRYSTTHFS